MIITDDSTLKITAGTTVSQFRQDLLGVYNLVLNARQTVQKLYIIKVPVNNTATNSAM